MANKCYKKMIDIIGLLLNLAQTKVKSDSSII